MIASGLVIAYVMLTILFWIGNRNVGRKRPMASAAKWFIWTATWTCFSIMVLETKPGSLGMDAIVGPVLVAPFAWPMMLVEARLSIAVRAVVLLAPWIAAATGYALAVRHNVRRADGSSAGA